VRPGSCARYDSCVCSLSVPGRHQRLRACVNSGRWAQRWVLDASDALLSSCCARSGRARERAQGGKTEGAGARERRPTRVRTPRRAGQRRLFRWRGIKQYILRRRGSICTSRTQNKSAIAQGPSRKKSQRTYRNLIFSSARNDTTSPWPRRVMLLMLLPPLPVLLLTVWLTRFFVYLPTT
jgi:hypothetical protein